MVDTTSGRSRTKWDARAEATRAAFVEEAVERLLTRSVGAVAGLCTPSALARSSEIVSVDTAYRLLGSGEETLRMVAERALAPSYSSDRLGWPTLDDVTADAAAAVAPTPDLDDVRAGFRLFVEANLRLPAAPLGRILDAVTMTASPRWEGTIVVADEDRELADAVLAARREQVASMHASLRWLVQEAMARLRRRPRAGLSVDQLTTLMHCLADGAVNRMLVDPDVMTVDELVDFVFTIGFALSEEGMLDDPRQPAAPDLQEVFAATVVRADAHWVGGNSITDLREAADATGVPYATVALMFETVADLADSVVRARTVSVGLGDATAEPATAVLASTLRRLAETADALPAVVTLAESAATPVAAELAAIATRLAEERTGELDTARRMAERLVASAAAGTGEWPTVELLLDLIRPRPERGAPAPA